MPQQVCLTLK
jgi:hypothetical protein